MSVARRVTRRFRSAARRARRHVPGTARRYAIGPGARNAARVTFATGCQDRHTRQASFWQAKMHYGFPSVTPADREIRRDGSEDHSGRPVLRVGRRVCVHFPQKAVLRGVQSWQIVILYGQTLCRPGRVPASLHFSPRGEAKWVRGPSGRGASRLARAGVLEQYVEHGKQAQRNPGGRIACFDRRVVRNAG